MSLMAASTRKGALLGGRHGELQQFAQRGCAGLVHGRAHRHLDGFQIQTPRLSATVEDDAQQLVYFARDLLADRFRRFFSSGESTSGSDGRSLADLRIDLDQFLMQTLQFPEFSDFSFGLSRCGLVGQGFGNSLAVDLVGQAEIGTMAWILGLMAMAVRFATSASGGSDRSTTQIAESGDLTGNVGPLLFQGFQRLWESSSGQPPILAYYIRTDIGHKKRNPAISPLSSRAPPESGRRDGPVTKCYSSCYSLIRVLGAFRVGCCRMMSLSRLAADHGKHLKRLGKR